MNTLDLLRANHRKTLDLAEQAVQQRDAAYKALKEIQALIDAGESGEAEMAAMLLHIGRITDVALGETS